MQGHLLERLHENFRYLQIPLVKDLKIKIPSVIVASKLVGKYDLISIIVVKDFQHLCELRENILEMPYVEKVETGMWINTMELYPHFFLI